jgi:anti-sigma B factor antagonist
MGLVLTVDDTPAETTVQCRGRIVSSNADSLRATIRPLIMERKTIWLDLTEVSYIDSSGLGTLVGLFITAERVKAYVKLINMNQRIRQLFSMTRLGQFFIEGHDPDYPHSPIR